MVYDFLNQRNPGTIPGMQSRDTLKKSAGYALATIVRVFRENGVKLRAGEYPIDTISRHAAIQMATGRATNPRGMRKIEREDSEAVRFTDLLYKRDENVARVFFLLDQTRNLSKMHASRVFDYTADPNIFRAFQAGCFGTRYNPFPDEQSGLGSDTKTGRRLMDRMAVAYVDGQNLAAMKQRQL
ncbi:MAG: hypothetical protein AABX00_00875 [Nanoarchaeota archaeon]|mgnify:FL=1